MGLDGPVAKFAKRDVIAGPVGGAVAEDDVVKDLDSKEFSGPDEVAGHLDVGFAWCRVPRGVVMLWDAGTYVWWRAERLGTRPVFQA